MVQKAAVYFFKSVFWNWGFIGFTQKKSYSVCVANDIDTGSRCAAFPAVFETMYWLDWPLHLTTFRTSSPTCTTTTTIRHDAWDVGHHAHCAAPQHTTADRCGAQTGYSVPPTSCRSAVCNSQPTPLVCSPKIIHIAPHRAWYAAHMRLQLCTMY